MRMWHKAIAALAVGVLALGAPAEDAKTKVVFVAGPPSHGIGEHEHIAGCELLAKSLKEGMPNVETFVSRGKWPEDESVFDGAAAIVVYSDGGPGHVINRHIAKLEELMNKGVGLVCIHYAVEEPKGKLGDKLMSWIGGYFEPDWSVNPHWDANYESLPQHPIASGVPPFGINDEWYYHMRFVPDMKDVTPILTALPTESSLSRPDGPHEGNPAVREAVAKGEKQHMAWAYERPDGGRGFGFTGGHVHDNWQNDHFRTLVLNAIAWTAKLDVPAEGVKSTTPTDEQMKENLKAKE